MNRILKFALGLALTIVLSSCASVSVQNEASSATLQMPQRIYVEAFSTTNGKFKVDREDAELANFKQNLQSMMQAASVKDLSQRLIPAMPASEQQNFSPENAWVIRGEFTRVNQGSRLLRGVVGFGAGGTKVETNVAVYDLNRNSNVPFLTFSTTGGSNAEPGAVTGGATDPVVAAVGIAASGAGGIAHGLTEDTSRTAREITAELSDYMYRNGWISKDKWIQPKEVKP
jgi:Domain of unknown function (DUF4410)